jgi:hypothetical protein
MTKRPPDTSAEEPDGGNPHIRFRGGPRLGDRPGLLNRWTPSGAHQLLQVRTRVLNQQLRGDFERWHPRLQSAPEPVRLAAQHRNGPLSMARSHHDRIHEAKRAASIHDRLADISDLPISGGSRSARRTPLGHRVIFPYA